MKDLQQAGGNVIYTEYNGGGHMDGIAMGLCTPVAVDWLLAQRRGQVSTNEPLVKITGPASAAQWQTGGAAIDLSGSAAANGQAIAQVSWTNFANSACGVASGADLWSITGIPLQTNRTNMVIVTATTTSWAAAGFGGATTFNDSLQVICAPIQLTIAPQEMSLTLNWTGGGPPFSLQSSTELPSDQWTEIQPDAKPPVTVPLDGNAVFYRVVGR